MADNPFVEYAEAHSVRNGQCYICNHSQRVLMEEAYAKGVRYKVMLTVLQEQGDTVVTYARISNHFYGGHHKQEPFGVGELD